jgi:hypothetical protein
MDSSHGCPMATVASCVPILCTPHGGAFGVLLVALCLRHSGRLQLVLPLHWQRGVLRVDGLLTRNCQILGQNRGGGTTMGIHILGSNNGEYHGVHNRIYIYIHIGEIMGSNGM